MGTRTRRRLSTAAWDRFWLGGCLLFVGAVWLTGALFFRHPLLALIALLFGLIGTPLLWVVAGLTPPDE